MSPRLDQRLSPGLPRVLKMVWPSRQPQVSLESEKEVGQTVEGEGAVREGQLVGKRVDWKAGRTEGCREKVEHQEVGVHFALVASRDLHGHVMRG